MIDDLTQKGIEYHVPMNLVPNHQWLGLREGLHRPRASLAAVIRRTTVSFPCSSSISKSPGLIFPPVTAKRSAWARGESFNPIRSASARTLASNPVRVKSEEEIT